MSHNKGCMNKLCSVMDAGLFFLSWKCPVSDWIRISTSETRWFGEGKQQNCVQQKGMCEIIIHFNWCIFFSLWNCLVLDGIRIIDLEKRRSRILSQKSGCEQIIQHSWCFFFFWGGGGLKYLVFDQIGLITLKKTTFSLQVLFKNMNHPDLGVWISDQLYKNNEKL